MATEIEMSDYFDKLLTRNKPIPRYLPEYLIYYLISDIIDLQKEIKQLRERINPE